MLATKPSLSTFEYIARHIGLSHSFAGKKRYIINAKKIQRFIMTGPSVDCKTDQFSFWFQECLSLLLEPSKAPMRTAHMAEGPQQRRHERAGPNRKC